MTQEQTKQLQAQAREFLNTLIDGLEREAKRQKKDTIEIIMFDKGHVQYIPYSVVEDFVQSVRVGLK